MIINCNGMIRSGSTLQYNIVRSMLKRVGYDYKLLGFMNKETIMAKEEFLLKCIESETIYLLKSHEYTFLNKENVLTIYSYRDIRDVGASAKKKFYHTNDELIDVLLNTIAEQEQILQSKNILVMRYESMFLSIEDAIDQISKFLDFHCTSQCKNDIKNENSIETMKKLQDNNTLEKYLKKTFLIVLRKIKIFKFFVSDDFILKIRNYLRPHNTVNLLHNNHISNTSGQNGTWKEVLNEYEINAINDKLSDWLVQYDYK